MFSNGKSLPPPPSSGQARNESLGASLPTYRSRPSGAGAAGLGLNFSSVRSMFESAKPMGTVIGNLARNPAVQSAAIAVAKDEKMQAAAISAAQNPHVRNAAIDFAMLQSSKNANSGGKSQQSQSSAWSKSTSSKVDEIARQFQNRPIMGFGGPSAPATDTRSTGDPFGAPPPIGPKPTSVPSASLRNPFDFPPQLPSSPTEKYRAQPPLYDDTTYDAMEAYRKKTAPPSRPPPPKMTLSRSNPNLNRLADELRGIDFSATAASPPPGILNEPYAIVKYPYREANADELSCQPDDIVILKREVDEQWIYATNTRTGRSGIVPILFLQIRVPLAPMNVTNSGHDSTTDWQRNRNKMCGQCVAARAIYDYNTGVEGDLQFNAGDTIVVNSRVNADWLRGEIGGKSGIFPLNFVNFENSADLNRLADESQTKSVASSGLSSDTLTALFDYTSDVDGDLSFCAGDVIEVLQRHDGGQWVTGRSVRTGATGLVPLTYVQ